MSKVRSLKITAYKMAAVAAVALMVMISAITFLMLGKTTMQNYKTEANHEMAYAVSMLDVSYIEELKRNTDEIYRSLPENIQSEPFVEEYVSYFLHLTDDERFVEAKRILGLCRETTGLYSVSILYADKEKERIIILIDAFDENSYFPGQWISRENGAIDTIEDIEMVEASNWRMTVGYGEYNGWTATDYMPLYGEGGEQLGYVTCDVNFNDFFERMMLFFAVFFVVLVISTVLVFVGVSRLLDRRVITPVNTIAETANKYIARDKTLEAEGEEELYFDKLSFKTGDEIEVLCNSLSDMEVDMNETLQRIREMASAQEKLNAELSVATSIQEGMLPNVFPAFPERTEFDIYASMDPAKEVGGDLYDFFLIDDDHLALVVGDVSGKGIPAALFMVIAKTVIRNIALRESDIKTIMAMANDQLCESNKENLFVTVWLGIYTISEKKLISSSAGHEYPAVYRAKDDEFKLYMSEHDIPMGIMEGMEYSSDEMILEKGDKIFVYSDGVPEATRADDKMYGTDRMIKSLNDNRHKSCKDILDGIQADVDLFIEGAPQFDDLTMLLFEILE